MLVSLTQVLNEANKGGYAVGAFNVCNLETCMAIVQAAEETGKAVILNYAPVHSPLLSIDIAAPIMLDLAKKATVPVCVHLDHGSSFDECMKAIRLGFTSIMYDCSDASYEENVANTALIVKLAHSVGVSVEAELGHIFSSDIGIGEKPSSTETADDFSSLDDVYTNPDQAKDFVERTGVDALAIAFGTTHGIYTQTPKLDLDRITAIKNKIDIPFVMHGGSGLSKDEFQTAIKNGIRKINYYTYMTLAGGKAVKAAMDQFKTDDNIFFHDVAVIAIEAMKENAKQAIEIFSMEGFC